MTAIIAGSGLVFAGYLGAACPNCGEAILIRVDASNNFVTKLPYPPNTPTQEHICKGRKE